MATQTAPVGFPYASTDLHPRPDALAPRAKGRILWPWPVFLLGAAALCAVALGRQYIRPTHGDRLKRDLNEMRKLVERTPSDLGRARTLGQHILDSGNEGPQYIGEAHYLFGCLHLRKADDPATLDAETELKEAVAHFEKAEMAVVPEADRLRLAHKLGKSLLLLDRDPETALDRMLHGEDPDNPVERLDIIAQLHLRQAKPNLAAAEEATQSELAIAPPNGDIGAITKARLRLADVQQQQAKFEDAARTLERIDRNAPPEMYLPSRMLLARILQGKGDFKKAAKVWTEVKSTAQLKVEQRAAAFFELGFCHARLAQTADALEAWKEAQVAGGPAGQAALLRQGELLQADPTQRAQAISAFEHALENVAKPADYRNEMVPAAEARRVLETACGTFRADRDFASASKVAELYGKLTPAGKSRELPAEIAAAWGQVLWTEGAGNGATAAHARDEAHLQFRKAGSLFAEAAADRPAGEQVDCFSKAVDQFFKAGDKLDVEAGLVLLERVEKMEPARTANGEVAFRKAMALQNLGDIAKAMEEYKKIAQQPDNRQAARARYQIAFLSAQELPKVRAEADTKLDEIARDLEKNVDPSMADRDRAVHEMSLYLLADVLYQRRDWLKAETHVETALRLYPSNPRANYARFMMGQCWWFQAYGEHRLLAKLTGPDRDATDKRYRDYLKNGRENFEKVERDLLALEKDMKLPDADRPLLRQASERAADCYFFDGGNEEIAEAARRYDVLRIKYEGKLSAIVALSQLWQCYEVYLKDYAKADAAIKGLREALKTIADTEFDGSAPFKTRQFWENWLEVAAAKSRTPANPPKG